MCQIFEYLIDIEDERRQWVNRVLEKCRWRGTIEERNKLRKCHWSSETRANEECEEKVDDAKGRSMLYWREQLLRLCRPHDTRGWDLFTLLPDLFSGNFIGHYDNNCPGRVKETQITLASHSIIVTVQWNSRKERTTVSTSAFRFSRNRLVSSLCYLIHCNQLLTWYVHWINNSSSLHVSCTRPVHATARLIICHLTLTVILIILRWRYVFHPVSHTITIRHPKWQCVRNSVCIQETSVIGTHTSHYDHFLSNCSGCGSHLHLRVAQVLSSFNKAPQELALSWYTTARVRRLTYNELHTCQLFTVNF